MPGATTTAISFRSHFTLENVFSYPVAWGNINTADLLIRHAPQAEYCCLVDLFPPLDGLSSPSPSPPTFLRLGRDEGLGYGERPFELEPVACRVAGRSDFGAMVERRGRERRTRGVTDGRANGRAGTDCEG